MLAPEQLALQMINETQAAVFITGKAGTGKTTFLKNLAQHTHKSMIITAPTGIAALQAGGVTLHSMFQLPFGLFLPEWDTDPYVSSAQYSVEVLYRKNILSKQRKEVLNAIDLLVIDEVSMLRADVLDAIHFRMQQARNNQAPFGGVQVVFIGDLYQLPPVVKKEERERLEKYYASEWFFDAKILQKMPLHYVALTTIYRQTDTRFIALLNEVRQGKLSAENISLLNAHYQQDAQTTDNILLTTHNYKADAINTESLAKLKGKPIGFTATITGDFPESMYPAATLLTLKVDTRVMFIKNDSSPNKQYFNGKLATIRSIGEKEITVQFDDGEEMEVSKEVWKNIIYSWDENTKKITEKTIGTFEQYPLKLAWAITIHKSQGLTFDKAVIDAADAFANGQVYVALSRLRTLDGLVLVSKIPSTAISTSHYVTEYESKQLLPEELSHKLPTLKAEYMMDVLKKRFDCNEIIEILLHTQKTIVVHQKEVSQQLEDIGIKLQTEQSHLERYYFQLLQLYETHEWTKWLERIDKGALYYAQFIDQAIDIFKKLEPAKKKKRKNKLSEAYTEMLQVLMDKQEVLKSTAESMRKWTE